MWSLGYEGTIDAGRQHTLAHTGCARHKRGRYALDENDVKVTSVSIDLFDKMVSSEEVYQKSMEDVEKELRERERYR
ncbi:MAG: hypothetical protein FGF48_11245 [Candidatus Brockarchaeota archaeon]|nr:hypothetical protein [Candidatus Brockarchaeota archaeon]